MPQNHSESDHSLDLRRMAAALADDPRAQPVLDRVAADARARAAKEPSPHGGLAPLADVLATVVEAVRESAFSREAIALEILRSARAEAARESRRSAKEAIEGRDDSDRNRIEHAAGRSASVSAMMRELLGVLSPSGAPSGAANQPR